MCGVCERGGEGGEIKEHANWVIFVSIYDFIVTDGRLMTIHLIVVPRSVPFRSFCHSFYGFRSMTE